MQRLALHSSSDLRRPIHMHTVNCHLLYLASGPSLSQLVRAIFATSESLCVCLGLEALHATSADVLNSASPSMPSLYASQLTTRAVLNSSLGCSGCYKRDVEFIYESFEAK